MNISQIARSIVESATLKLNETAAILRVKGGPGIERMSWPLDPNSPNEPYPGDRKLVRDWS